MFPILNLYIVASKSRNKNGFKGKYTSTLLVPKQKKFFQSNNSKKIKVPSTMAIIEKNNFGSNLKPKIQVEVQVLECKASNATSPKKQQSCKV